MSGKLQLVSRTSLTVSNFFAMTAYIYFIDEDITEPIEPLDLFLGNNEDLVGSAVAAEMLEPVQVPNSSTAIQANFLESKKIKDFGKHRLHSTMAFSAA